MKIIILPLCVCHRRQELKGLLKSFGLILHLTDEETELGEVKSHACDHTARKWQSCCGTYFPSILERNNLLLWVNTHHPGLSEHAAQPFVIRGFVSCPVCCPHAAKLWFRRKARGVLCSLCNQLMTKSNFMTQSMLKLLALHNFPHRKPIRFLVTFRVFRGWHRTHPKIDVSCSPRRDLQPKNVTPSPFQNRHHCLGRSPSFPTWQLPKDKLSSHLETRLPSWGRKRNANCQ